MLRRPTLLRLLPLAATVRRRRLLLLTAAGETLNPGVHLDLLQGQALAWVAHVADVTVLDALVACIFSFKGRLADKKLVRENSEGRSRRIQTGSSFRRRCCAHLAMLRREA